MTPLDELFAAIDRDAPNEELVALARAARQPDGVHQRVERWLRSNDTGSSSKYMCAVLFGGPAPRRERPHDRGDFGRCVWMLRAIPELRDRLDILATGHGIAWMRIAENWDELEALYDAEENDPDYHGTTKWSPRRRRHVTVKAAKDSVLYERLKALTETTPDEDGCVTVSPRMAVRLGR